MNRFASYPFFLCTILPTDSYLIKSSINQYCIKFQNDFDRFTNWFRAKGLTLNFDKYHMSITRFHFHPLIIYVDVLFHVLKIIFRSWLQII